MTDAGTHKNNRFLLMEENKVKEKNTNENPSKRDPWSMLQTQLGLVSSPVEHEQISVVGAVDPQDQDQAPQNNEAFEVKSNSEVSSPPHDNETVVVNIDLPPIAENDSWDALPHQDADDLFDFDDFGDSGIPKNAFAPPKKSKPSRKTATAVDVPLEEPPQHASDMPAFASESQFAENESVIDPLLSDELPTSLWQPRKSASVAKPKSTAPSFGRDTLRHSEAKEKEAERKSESREPAPSPMPIDDLAKHSSGKNRRERSQDQPGNPEDRRIREPSRRGPYRDRREDTQRVSESRNQRQHPESAAQAAFDGLAFDDSRAESSLGELAWEPKPRSRGKSRKSDKSSYSSEEPSVPFADGATERESFAADLGRDTVYEKEWLNEDDETVNPGTRIPRSHRKRNSSAEPKKVEPEKDSRNAFDKNESHDRFTRKEREPSPPPSRQQHRTESSPPAAESSSQKIAVASWDDAVRDIIEKNMQRRPASSNKNERDRRNGGGRGHRR